jgi:uncharacterized repeat protein (TIGR03803 family)
MRIDRRKRLGLLAAAIALPIALASPVQAEAAGSNFATIANFDGNDGSAPAALTPFTDGAFYGVAGSGPGVLNDGVVFRFDPASNLLTMLYAFDGTAGAFPQGRVVLGPSGAIFGVTYLYGSAGGGTVFEYRPATQVMKVLHAFTSGLPGRPHAQPALRPGRLPARYYCGRRLLRLWHHLSIYPRIALTQGGEAKKAVSGPL